MTTNTISSYSGGSTAPNSASNPIRDYANVGDISKTAEALFRAASGWGNNPNISFEYLADIALARIDQMAAMYDGSSDNTRELNAARAAILEFKKMMRTLDDAVARLPPVHRRQLLLELFGFEKDNKTPVVDDILGLFGAKKGVKNDQSPMLGGVFEDEIAKLVVALISDHDDAWEYAEDKLVGWIPKDSSDYKPPSLDAKEIAKAHERLHERLERLAAADDAFTMPTAATMDSVVEGFMSDGFMEGQTFDVMNGSEREQKTEYIMSVEIDARLVALEAWVGGLDDDKRQRMESILRRVPSLVDVINEAIGIAEGADKKAYIAMFLGSSGEPKFSGDNPELNASNVGKLIAAVISEDYEALKEFADMDLGKLDEIVLDFLKVEGEFRQARDITEGEGKAAKDYFENVTVPLLQGQDESEESEEEKRLLAARQAWQMA